MKLARTARAVDNRLREVAVRTGTSTYELRQVYLSAVRGYSGDGDAHLWGIANAYGHALGDRVNLVRAIEGISLGQAISSGMFSVRDAMYLKGSGGRFIGSRRHGSQTERSDRGRAVRSSKAGSFGRAEAIAQRRHKRRMTDAEAYRTDPASRVKSTLGDRVGEYGPDRKMVSRKLATDLTFDGVTPEEYNARQQEARARLPQVLSDASEAGVGFVSGGDNPFPDPTASDLEILRGHPDTQHMHAERVMDDGRVVYTDERAALHDKIIADFFKGKSEPDLAEGEKPIAFFMAGGAASGKSSIRAQEHFDSLPKKPDGSSPTPEEVGAFLDNLDGDAMTNTIVVNPDLIKEQLPEYKQLADSGSLYAATGVHEESSDLAKRLQAEAMERGFHVVIDGTGDSGEDKMGGKLKAANESGFDVRVAVVSISTEDAMVRAWDRFDNGRKKFESGDSDVRPRMVPLGIIEEQHASVSKFFISGGSRDPDLAKGFHGLDFITNGTVYDNSGPFGSEAAPIAKFDNGELVVINDFLFQKFIDKMNGLDTGVASA